MLYFGLIIVILTSMAVSIPFFFRMKYI